MHAWIRRALCAVGLAGGVILLGFGLAQAASADSGHGPVTTGESGILSGNQTGADVRAPINLSGNQVTVIGQHNQVASAGTSSAAGGGSPAGSPTTSGKDGIGSGNQTAVGVRAPVNVSGNQVTVIGQHNTTKAAGGSAAGGPASASGTPGSGPTTSGQDGIGSGNQTAVGIRAPINVAGNQITVIGQGNSVQSLAGTSTAAGGSGAGAATTSGEHGIGSGNQTALGLALPVDVSGNQVTVIGQHNTVSSAGGSTTGGPAGPPSGGPVTSGSGGLLSGNQTGIAVAAPIAATGNQVTVIGQDNTVTSTGGSSAGGGSTGTGQTTTGAGGIGSGNQTPISVEVPIDTSGNQVTVVGQGNTVTSTGGSTSGGTTSPPGGTTSPPTGGVVSPPTSGGSTSTAVAAPGSSVLPDTGSASGLVPLALLGLLLVALGSALSRRRGAVLTTA